MEGALARYIVTRWSTPCIELVCEFLFLKKTNFILYSQSLIPTPTCWQTSKRNSKRNLRFTKLHSFIQFRLILFPPNWVLAKITGLINKGEPAKLDSNVKICRNSINIIIIVVIVIIIVTRNTTSTFAYFFSLIWIFITGLPDED